MLNISLGVMLVLRRRPTECQKQRDDSLNFLQQDVAVTRDVSQCTPDGSYDDIQCSPATGECWCVYYSNIEIRGTRTLGKPSCPPTGKALDPNDIVGMIWAISIAVHGLVV